MYRFVVTMHVLAAVLLTGPAAVIPFLAVRGLAQRDAEQIRRVAKRTLQLGAVTLVIAAFGVLALNSSDTYRFGTPWVTISITVYVIALLIDVAALPAIMSRAARHVEEAHTASPEVADTPDDPAAAALAGARVDQHRGRLLALGGLALVLYALVAVLMAAKPFGE
ncbi:DUF2269 family protein [Phytomonospora sp. NPDC050363]|uniref:DUF2269 family protein n=1 Tax=Phytomonospora sp. NPDC050363 TaxID=3155642 RepID=UPI0033CC3048